MATIAEADDGAQDPSPTSDHILHLVRELGRAGLDGTAIMRAVDQRFPNLSYRVFLDAVMTARAAKAARLAERLN